MHTNHRRNVTKRIEASGRRSTRNQDPHREGNRLVRRTSRRVLKLMVG
jgi:hypothetical protein